MSVDSGEARAAVVDNGDLAEFLVERPQHQRVVGNVYLGRVTDVLPGMDAAFVNVGLERNAFLYAGDAQTIYGEDDPPQGSKGRIQDLVTKGQDVLVQVVKDPTGTKGARITTAVGLPGRFVVLTPLQEFVGVSRRITDEEERSRLKAVAQSSRPKGQGVIVRTVAEGRSEEDIRQDVTYLSNLWDKLKGEILKSQAPALIYRDLGLTGRLARDFMTEDVKRMWVDSRQEYEKLLELAQLISPDLRNRIRFFKGKDIFASRGIRQELERALKRRVWLKSGGYLVVDRTEALTAVDVNTGKYVGSQNLSATILKTNLEAAAEIAKQIRLRDLAGIIVVDFIDMAEEDHRKKVLAALDEAVKADRTKVHIVGITKLGLVELTRKRVGSGIDENFFMPCPTCEGWGRVFTDETVALRVRREIKAFFAKEKVEALLVEAYPSVAALLIGPSGSNLKELERDTQRTIYVRGSLELERDKFQIVVSGTREEVEARARPVSQGDVLELRVEGPHVSNAQDGIARVEGYVIDIEKAGQLVGEKVQVQIVQTYKTYAKAKIVRQAAVKSS